MSLVSPTFIYPRIMGIDTEIPNEHLRKHTSAKNPYIWTFDPRSSITCPWLDIHQDQMVYNDLSEKMRHIPRFNPITTPNPLLAAIDYLYRFIVFYTNQKVAMVTLVLDKKKYVPKEKKLEQDRRREVAAFLDPSGRSSRGLERLARCAGKTIYAVRRRDRGR